MPKFAGIPPELGLVSKIKITQYYLDRAEIGSNWRKFAALMAGLASSSARPSTGRSAPRPALHEGEREPERDEVRVPGLEEKNPDIAMFRC